MKKKLSELYLWKDNPRGIKVNDFARLKKQIKELGLYKPFIITPDGEVLGGNMRLRACKELGINDVPVSIVKPTTEADKLKYALSDNDRAGYYEEDALAELIDKYKDDIVLKDYKIDLGQPVDLQELLDRYSPVEEDEVPEVAESEPESKLGEIYQLGRHRLMCGDSTKKEDVGKLMDGKKADMVFTDPPFPSNTGVMKEMIVGIEDAFRNARAFCSGKMYWFWDNIGEPPFNEPVIARHVWYKTNGWQAGHWEAINVFDGTDVRGESLVYPFTNVGGKNIRSEQGKHLTPKPIALCIEFVKRGKLVLDLFGGSGSTLIACEQTNRICYMMEIDPRYCDVIRKRYDNYRQKTEK